MAKKPIPTPDELRQLLRYEADTGRLFWLPREIQSFADHRTGKTWNTRFSGKEAFPARADGYRHGTVNGRRLYAHRVIWAMVYGSWPKVIDHINGDQADNRMGNLRSIAHTDNSKNTARRTDNTSGVVGVYRNCSRYRLPWAAEIYVDKKKVKIGNFATIEAAAEARRQAEEQHGYHPNHGRL